jgi:DNA adenine methylase
MQKTAIKYPGGAAYKAKLVNSVLKTHQTFVDLCFGGGALLFAHDPLNCAEVVNDIDGLLMNFWDVLADEKLFQQFKRRAAMTGFDERKFRQAKALLPTPQEQQEMLDVDWSQLQSANRIELAWALFVVYRQSRQAMCKEFADLTTARLRRGMNEQCSAWLSGVEGLDWFHARLGRVVTCSRPAVEIVKRYDGKHVLFAVDPPFHPTTRMKNKYRCEMTHEQHMDLWDALGTIAGSCVIMGYNCEAYEQKRRQYGFHRIDYVIDNKADNGKQKRQVTESLWVNFEPSESALSQHDLSLVE